MIFYTVSTQSGIFTTFPHSSHTTRGQNSVQLCLTSFVNMVQRSLLPREVSFTANYTWTCSAYLQRGATGTLVDKTQVVSKSQLWSCQSGSLTSVSPGVHLLHYSTKGNKYWERDFPETRFLSVMLEARLKGRQYYFLFVWCETIVIIIIIKNLTSCLSNTSISFVRWLPQHLWGSQDHILYIKDWHGQCGITY